MPSIYSSLYTNFIRQGSTLAKSATTHGYAQSVIAATHLNSQNRPAFGRRNASRFSRLQQALQLSSLHTVSSSSTAAAAGNGTTLLGLGEHRLDRTILASGTASFIPAAGTPNNVSHGGLDAYFEALRLREADGEEKPNREWSQFQFQKRIEWKPAEASVSTGSAPVQVEAQEKLVVETQDSPGAIVVPRDIVEANSERHTDLKNSAQEPVLNENGIVRATSPVAKPRAPSPTISAPQSPRPSPPTPTPASQGQAQSPSVLRSASIDAQSHAYSARLLQLSETGQYAEIPIVFKAMLATGVRPTPSVYNAVLAAAINLSSQEVETVSRALDVYTDMLHRGVSPDSDTYNILVGLLAARSLEVSAMRQALEEKRQRFGGMDEPGKFMLASHELEYAIVTEDDRLDLAIKLFDVSTASKAVYLSETYHQIITACANAGRVADMVRLYKHLETKQTAPYAAIYAVMISAFSKSLNLVDAIKCYNEYRDLAIAHNNDQPVLRDRQDVEVYAAVISAYIASDKPAGAKKFYDKILLEHDAMADRIKSALIRDGFVRGFVERGTYKEALRWAQSITDDGTRSQTMGRIASAAADMGDAAIAVAAYANIAPTRQLVQPSMALLALNVRRGNVTEAAKYWRVLSAPEAPVDDSYIEPTAMFAVALIGSGQVAEGLTESEMMFGRIRASSDRQQVADEIDEATDFVSQYMRTRGFVDARETISPSVADSKTFLSTPTVSSFGGDAVDPHASNTDFKGSSLIAAALEGSPRRGPRLSDALNRLRNIRRAGRHPRYITYSKLISAAARESKMSLCHEILGMARTDVPLLPQYAVARYGWTSILDAMVGACVTAGDRTTAEQFHQELLAIGATPSANTFGLYITTLKESTHTFDEASEAVNIFHRAKAEGVEPSSFLYNALIGKLGKARRIDDCLFHFSEMRALGIKPTSVTYGTIVNALCRVSDEQFAEELFDEMESMANYKARPAPYNSMMQFFLTTRRDKSKVLAYYDRMKARKIVPTSHTYKLLIDTHATLEPVDMAAAEAVLESMVSAGHKAEPVHYAALIHARGCAMHDLEGARGLFDTLISDRHAPVPVHPSIFQALFEALVANHRVVDTEPLLATMRRRNIEMTPYIANTLIHGWANAGNVGRAGEIYDAVGRERREPSTYEAMTRAYLSAGGEAKFLGKAEEVVTEMLGRGYPGAVVNKVLELLGRVQQQEVVA